MVKRMMLVIFIFISGVTLLGDVCTEQIDYSEMKKIEWKSIIKNYVATNVQDISSEIDHEIMEEQGIDIEVFTNDERWVIKKYGKDKLLMPVYKKGDMPDIYWNNKIAIPNVGAFSNGDNNFLAYVYEHKNNYLIADGGDIIYEFNKNTGVSRIVVYMLDFQENFCYATRMIRLENECLYTVGWVNDITILPRYAYVKIYRYNLLKREVTVYDSYQHGIFTPAVDEIEGIFPRYDISMDKRFVYIPGFAGREYVEPSVFDREGVKVEGGLYVYDWEKNRVYKLASGNVVAVTNDTDDGFVYYKVGKRGENNRWEYDYFRIENPERMLKETE